MLEDFAKFLICIPAVIVRSRSGKFGSPRANLARGGWPGCEMAGWRCWLGESTVLRGLNSRFHCNGVTELIIMVWSLFAPGTWWDTALLAADTAKQVTN